MRGALALVLCAACGGPDEVDLTGVYQVSSAVGAMPCGTDVTIQYTTFVRFQKMELFDTPYFAYDGCAEAEAINCAPIGGLDGFFEPIDNGWLGFSSFSSGGGGFGDCLLGIREQTAILDGTTLTIESTGYEDTVPGLPEDQCSPDEAERRGKQMTCVDHSLVVAGKL
jgi:hypothetical protein